MTDMKTYEYIWLDGYTPEPFMRSKVKATDSSTPPDGHSMVLLRNKQKVEVQTVYSYQFKLMKTQMGMI